ncbi:hypothetical protein PG994_007803 [Apiospora phragmitis]|uniref:Uncharacterized protein n=1 Tax=Apiospora phragmitis TaxID=2905665 RepID=A0ABR1URB0_9PEZI
MSTINIVKYYFHSQQIPKTPERMHQLVALAYQTARDKQIYPRAVFIRSDLHDTTSINGVRQKDPKGLHITLCYKDDEHLQKGTHIACHGYVTDGESMSFKEATQAGEKPDVTKKNNKNRTPVWPSEDKLYAAPEIGYGHLD